MTRRLRLGMVGGGEGAFIGAVHRIAARLDDQFELVAGAFSSRADVAARSGAALFIAPDRSYASWQEMAAREAAREDGIDVVSIVTPNHLHVPVAQAFLERGIHVICDKPLGISLDEGRALAKTVRDSGCRFILTHNYSALPMVREARARVAAGELGDIRRIDVEYLQGWLSEDWKRPTINRRAGVAIRRSPGRARLAILAPTRGNWRPLSAGWSRFLCVAS